MRTPIVAGNWKMNKNIVEATELVNAMMADLESADGVKVVLCPPYLALEAVNRLLGDSSIALGAQDMHYEAHGAFTGEVAPSMLAELCSYVIIGHSERRHIFGETDASVGRKVDAALQVGLKPILCVGETLVERDDGLAEVIVEQQVKLGMARISGNTTGSGVGNLVVAYEPVWAIGTGEAATPEDAQGMMSHIRKVVGRFKGDDVADNIPLLYGGSVSAENVRDFSNQPDIDGGLIGGASLEADSFVKVVCGVGASA